MEISLSFVTTVYMEHLQSLEYGMSQQALANAFYFGTCIAYLCSHLPIKDCSCHRNVNPIKIHM